MGPKKIIKPQLRAINHRNTLFMAHAIILIFTPQQFVTDMSKQCFISEPLSK